VTYDSLSRIYDLLTEDFDYRLWTDKYLELLHSRTQTLSEICDAGCGTGSILTELTKRGLNVIGIDISDGMLREAQTKAMAAGFSPKLLRQDLREMKLAHRVDAVICACDGVNYLRTEKGAAAFFARAFDSIKPGGAFAFDFSSKQKLMALAETGLFAEEREEAAYIMFCAREDNIVRMDLTMFLKRVNGLFERLEENHVQRIWENEEIKKLLEQTGFKYITITENDLKGFGGDRVFAVCSRP
jgi:ubiquinone/menaquinone biosynthesis C-methylase UbiE